MSLYGIRRYESSASNINHFIASAICEIVAQGPGM